MSITITSGMMGYPWLYYRGERLKEKMEQKLGELERSTNSLSSSSNNNGDIDDVNPDDEDVVEYKAYLESISQAFDMMSLRQELEYPARPPYKITNEDLFIQVVDEKISSYLSRWCSMEEIIEAGGIESKSSSSLWNRELEEDDYFLNNKEDGENRNKKINKDTRKFITLPPAPVENVVAEEKRQETPAVTSSRKVRMPDIVFIPTMSRKSVVQESTQPTF